MCKCAQVISVVGMPGGGEAAAQAKVRWGGGDLSGTVPGRLAAYDSLPAFNEAQRPPLLQATTIHPHRRSSGGGGDGNNNSSSCSRILDVFEVCAAWTGSRASGLA